MKKKTAFLCAFIMLMTAACGKMDCTCGTFGLKKSRNPILSSCYIIHNNESCCLFGRIVGDTLIQQSGMEHCGFERTVQLRISACR